MQEKCSFYKFCRNTIKGLFILWYNPKFIGLDNIPKEGGAILAGNHKTMKDPVAVAISTKRVVHYLAKDKYAEKKGISWFFKAAKCITVHTNTKNKEAMSDAIEVLKSGGLIGIFPEGTRNKTQELLLPFKFGAVSMASKSDALIVPFGIQGDFKFRSKNLYIIFGKPFKANPNDLESSNELLQKEVKKLLTNNYSK